LYREGYRIILAWTSFFTFQLGHTLVVFIQITIQKIPEYILITRSQWKRTVLQNNPIDKSV
jgi:hypothetical protein